MGKSTWPDEVVCSHDKYVFEKLIIVLWKKWIKHLSNKQLKNIQQTLFSQSLYSLSYS